MTEYLKCAALSNVDVLKDPPVPLGPEVYEGHLRTMVKEDASMGDIAPILNETIRLKAEAYNNRNEKARLQETRARNIALKETQMLKNYMDKYDRAVRLERERMEVTKAARASALATAHTPEPITDPSPKEPEPEQSWSDQGFFQRVLVEEERKKQMASAFPEGEGISKMYPVLAPKPTPGIPPATQRGLCVEARLRQERQVRAELTSRLLEEETRAAKERKETFQMKRAAREAELSAIVHPQQQQQSSWKASPASDTVRPTLPDSGGEDGILPKPRIHPIDILQRQIAIALMESRQEEEAEAEDSVLYGLDAHLASEIDSWGAVASGGNAS